MKRPIVDKNVTHDRHLTVLVELC